MILLKDMWSVFKWKLTNKKVNRARFVAMISELRKSAAVNRALADEMRLRILNILVERGETCVCELMETLATTQSNVSFHLTVLKNAGLIADKKIGKWMFYSVDFKALERHLTALRTMFNKARVGTARPGTSIFTLCCADAVPLSRKHAKQKVEQLKTRYKAKRMR
jgi:ArsR family transcriptional regulator, arsenate/arsenite/antimonite-responsive transcriptional repressor